MIEGNRFSTETLRVGNKVRVYSSTGYGDGRYYVGEIVKKTPTGMIDVKYGNNIVERFKCNGSLQRKQERYSRSYTCIDYLSKEAEKEIREQNEKRSLISWLSKGVDWSTYTHDELFKIHDYIVSIR